MTAWYNEIDPYCAEWLRNLIRAELIAPGDVDERDIRDVVPTELSGYAQCHFFAGIGGWSAALRLAGWPDERPVWTGSCPCQPFSAAGARRGFHDERHLWPAWHWLIAQSRPRVVFGEQVESADGRRWLDLVSADLEEIGYACGAVVFPAAGIGAPHLRHRIWFVAGIASAGCPDIERWAGSAEPSWGAFPLAYPSTARFPQWLPEPEDGWMVDGVSANVGAVCAYGNAIVPHVAAEVIRAYMEAV